MDPIQYVHYGIMMTWGKKEISYLKSKRWNRRGTNGMQPHDTY